MRHRKTGRKFGMDPSARKAMLRNMVTSLMLHGRIRTTEAKAKELRRYAERVITMGKKARAAKLDRVHALRLAHRWVNNEDAIKRVFGEYAERFESRPGGYTRVTKMGRRPGDNAAMAVIEVLDAPFATAEAAPAGVETAAAPAAEAPAAETAPATTAAPAEAPAAAAPAEAAPAEATPAEAAPAEEAPKKKTRKKAKKAESDENGGSDTSKE